MKKSEVASISIAGLALILSFASFYYQFFWESKNLKISIVDYNSRGKHPLADTVKYSASILLSNEGTGPRSIQGAYLSRHTKVPEKLEGAYSMVSKKPDGSYSMKGIKGSFINDICPGVQSAYSEINPIILESGDMRHVTYNMEILSEDVLSMVSEDDTKVYLSMEFQIVENGSRSSNCIPIGYIYVENNDVVSASFRAISVNIH